MKKPDEEKKEWAKDLLEAKMSNSLQCEYDAKRNIVYIELPQEIKEKLEKHKELQARFGTYKNMMDATVAEAQRLTSDMMSTMANSLPKGMWEARAKIDGDYKYDYGKMRLELTMEDGYEEET